MISRRPRSRKPLSARFGESLDNWILALAPRWGSRRLHMRRVHDLMAKRIERLSTSWDNDTDSRVRGHRWLASGLSTDTLLKYNLAELQKRMSELYRKNIVAHGAIEGRVSNEVGVGIVAQSQIKKFSREKNKEIGDAIEDIIEQWSMHGVDRGRVLSLAGLQRQACRSYASHGECFAIFGDTPFRGPISLAVELVAPERVETPPEKQGDKTVKLGVQFDKNEQVIGYYVRTQHPGDERNEFKYEYVPRFHPNGQPRMVHVFEPLFPGQTRGMPWLTACMNRLKDLDDFFEAELIAKQIEACFGVFIKGGKQSLSGYARATANVKETDSDGRRIEELEPGLVQYLDDEEEPFTIDPQRPGSTFVPFVEASLRSIAAAANYPYELLAKNFFRTTFSSGRLALLDGRLGFRMRRQPLVDQLLCPLYRRIVYLGAFESELNGTIDLLDYRSDPNAYERHKWIAQVGDPHVDPQKEIGADKVAVEEGFKTIAHVAAQTDGGDWEDIKDQRAEEMKRDVEIEVEVRKYRMDLEEKAGLTPSEGPESEQGQDEESPAKQPAGAASD